MELLEYNITRYFRRKSASFILRITREVEFLRFSHMPLCNFWPDDSRRHELPKPLVVSLTSFPPRFRTLRATLNSLHRQTVRPDRVILWVATSDFQKLPVDVASGSEWLEIRTCPDIRSYKKIIPALQAFKDHFIVTADDDIVYDRNWLETLVSAWRHTDEIIAYRSHRVVLQPNGLLAPYSEWEFEHNSPCSSIFNCATTGAGALFPPSVLFSDVTRDDLFLAYSATSDDIWLYLMAFLKMTPTRTVTARKSLLFSRASRISPLSIENNARFGNDRAVHALNVYYQNRVLDVTSQCILDGSSSHPQARG